MPRKSIGEYPSDWKEIAFRVKTEAGWCCVRCNHPDDPKAGHMLTVHHLDMDKSNCVWFNLLALCQRCHLSIQARVVLERPWLMPHSLWFRPYVAGYYAHVHGLNTDREWVLAHIDELLDIGQTVRLETE